MNKNLKIAIILLVCALIFGIILANKNKTKKNNTPGVLKIGAILPLSGDLTYVGEEMRRGMEMALDDTKEKNVKIVYEDDLTFDIKASVNAASKLVNSDHVDVLLNSVVDTIKGVAPILNQKKVPGVVIWDSNKTINNLGDYVFGMGLSTEHAGEDMADLAYNKLGLRHISIVSNFNEWSEIISIAFKNEFTKLGGTIDYHERVEINTNDVRVNLAKIKSKQSQGIYFPLYNPSLSSLIKQAKNLGFKGYLFTGDVLTDADIKVLGKNVEGIYTTQAYLNSPEFLKKYKQKYGQEVPATNLAFAGLGYDTVNFLLAIKNELVSQKIPVNSQTIRDHIINFEYNGVTGKTIFSPQRITDKREAILQVQNGALVKP